MTDSQEPGIKQSECSCVIDRAVKEGLFSTSYDALLVKTEARGGNTAMRTETKKKYNWVER